MKAVVFAGGRGSRLSKLLGGFNKHLLPMGREAVIEVGLSSLRKGGITELLIITNHGWQDAFDFLLKEKGGNFFSHVEIKASKSPDLPLAEVLYDAKDFTEKEDFLLFLGDNLFVGPIEKKIKYLIREKDSSKIILSYASDPSRFGIPVFRNTKIEYIIEKPAMVQSPWVVTGLARYTPEVYKTIEFLLMEKFSRPDLTEMHNILISEEKLKYSFWNETWFDIGTPDAYIKSIITLGKKKDIQSLFSNCNLFSEIIFDSDISDKLSFLSRQFCNDGV